MLKEKQELSKLKTCEECNYSFYNMKQLKEHIELNHQVSKRFFHNYQNNIEKDRQFKCEECNVVYNSNKDLTRHLLNKHYGRTYECGVCKEVFKRKDSLIRHQQVMHESNKFTCNYCGENFSRKDAMKRHIVDAHGENNISNSVFKCEKCDTSFSVKRNFERHEKSYQNKDGSFAYQCDDCQEYFCTGKILRKHTNLHHIGLSCKHCDKLFTQKKSLEYHLRTRNPVSCKDCQNTFCNMKSLNSHRIDAHESVKCDQCGQTWFKYNIENHKLWDHK